MTRPSLFLALCLVALPAQASSVHLLAPDDAPVAGAAAPSVAATADTHHLSGTTHFLLAAGVGVFAVPASLYLASFFGGLPAIVPGSMLGSLLLSGLPALLVMGFGAPLVVTLVAQFIGNAADPGRYRFWGPFWLTSLVNIAALVVGGALGLSVGVPLRVILFSLVDGVLLGGSSVSLMRLFENKPEAVALVPSFVPGVSETRVLPLARVAF